MMPTLADIVKAFYGVFLLARRHPSAASFFECTPSGFWKSLFAAFLAVPAHAIVTMRGLAYQGGADYGVHDGVSDLMIYAIVWLSWPLVMANVANALGRDDRFLDYIVPYNWVSVPVAFLFAAIALLGLTGIASAGVEAAITIAAYIATIAFLMEVTRRQLKVRSGMAFGLVMLDFLFSTMVVKMLESLSGRV